MLFSFKGILAEKFLFFHINKPELPLFFIQRIYRNRDGITQEKQVIQWIEYPCDLVAK